MRSCFVRVDEVIVASPWASAQPATPAPMMRISWEVVRWTMDGVEGDDEWVLCGVEDVDGNKRFCEKDVRVKSYDSVHPRNELKR